MDIELKQGANHLLATGGKATVTVSWVNSPGNVDVACFMLGADGKVASDDWMVFYNQPAAPGNLVRMNLVEKTATFQIDLDSLPESISRCCFTTTLDGGGAVGAIEGLVLCASGTGDTVRVVPAQLGNERALMLADVYRHAGGWKVRAVAQGFDGGLAPLASHFGVVIEEAADSAAPPEPPKPPVNLGKVTLDKPAQSAPINLGKKLDGTLEHVAVRMDWTSAVDLDLHAFYRLKSGEEGEVNFMEEGHLDQAPFIAIDDDMGVGEVAGKNEENLTLSRLDTLDSVIFAVNIYSGDDEDPESFAQYDGRVTVTTSLGEVVVPLTSKVAGNWAVIAKLENRGQPRLININRVMQDEPKLSDFEV